MNFFKKLTLTCLMSAFAMSSLVANHDERKKEALRDQKNSELTSGLLKGAGIALLFAIGSVAADRLADAIAPEDVARHGYGFIYSLLKGASSGLALGTIPCVLSGISGKENSRAWLGMAVSASVIGAVNGTMVSRPVTSHAKDIWLVGEVFKKLHGKDIHPSSAAHMGVAAVAVFSGIKPTVHKFEDKILGKFYSDKE